MHSSPEMFRWVVEASSDGIWVFDLEGRTTYANERLATLLGRTVEEMDGFPVFEALDEVGQGQFRDHLMHLSSTESGDDNLECMFLRKDGRSIWALVSYSAIRDDDGQHVGWLHRVTDYTERKLLLEKLRESEQQLAQAQNIAKLGSWEWDVATDRVSWSDELFRIYNLEPQQFEATYAGYLDYVHPEDRPTVEASVGSAFTSGANEFGFDSRIIREGGELGWVRGRGVVRRDASGAPIWMGGTAQDITEIKRTEQKLSETSDRFRLLQVMASAANEAERLVDALDVAVIELAAHTGWSPGPVFCCRDLQGMRPLPVPSADASRVHGEVERKLAQRALMTRSTTWCNDRRQDCAGDCGTIAIPILADDEVVSIIELVSADPIEPDPVTLETIEQVTGQLTRVAERERTAAALAAARDEAMEASRMKSEFLATMSHEIRTPLNGVLGLNELLLRSGLDDKQRQLAMGVQGAGQTLLGLINDILDLSKIEAGKLELEAVDFDVRSVFEQAAGLLGEASRAKDIELVVACHPDVPQLLRGDPVRLGQVITNLGSNAVKFTDEGEVVIHARIQEQSRTTVTLRVEVTDTGVGIPTEQQERLFDAFAQADASTTRRYGGTGLGLAISKQLVSAIGGEIGVTSREGEGSTFWFTAVLDRPSSQQSPLRPTTTPHRLADKRVLVVDDNATNRLILTEQLRSWEVDAVTAASAHEAMVALRKAVADGRPIDMVLLDLCMPDVDGLELARQIRGDSEIPEPLLLLLSSSLDVDRQALEQVGVSIHLSKPVLHSQLFNALVEALAKDAPTLPAVTDASLESREPNGKSVLVVEDNPVNQVVATGLLESLGYDVTVAADGVVAVELMANGHDFAAVLMDCQMPRLDGYNATQQIRQGEEPGHRIPIIAMTASAIEGERERCEAAGMDDFLTKPIDPELLETTLTQWTEGGEGAARRDQEPAERSVAVLDRDRLTMLYQLKPGDTSMFDRFVNSFLSDAETSLRAIRAAVDGHDAEALVSSAHRMKGSALNLGVPQVGATCAALELLGDEGRLDGAPLLLEQLSREVDVALTALRRVADHGLAAIPD